MSKKHSKIRKLQSRISPPASAMLKALWAGNIEYRIKKSRNLILRFYCFALIMIGTLGLHSMPMFQTSSPQQGIEPQTAQVDLTSIPVPENAYRKALPTHIKIKNLVDQTIQEFDYAPDGMPVISNDHVSHLIDSARPGENGNMILYGHNLTKILGKMRFTKVGDVIDITNADSELVQYKVTAVEIVETTETHWLEQTDNAVITVYTCIGWMDSQRLVVRGELMLDSF